MKDKNDEMQDLVHKAFKAHLEKFVSKRQITKPADVTRCLASFEFEGKKFFSDEFVAQRKKHLKEVGPHLDSTRLMLLVTLYAINEFMRRYPTVTERDELPDWILDARLW